MSYSLSILFNVSVSVFNTADIFSCRYIIFKRFKLKSGQLSFYLRLYFPLYLCKIMSSSHWVSLNVTFFTFQSYGGDIWTITGTPLWSCSNCWFISNDTFITLRLSVMRRGIRDVAMWFFFCCFFLNFFRCFC